MDPLWGFRPRARLPLLNCCDSLGDPFLPSAALGPGRGGTAEHGPRFWVARAAGGPRAGTGEGRRPVGRVEASRPPRRPYRAHRTPDDTNDDPSRPRVMLFMSKAPKGGLLDYGDRRRMPVRDLVMLPLSTALSRAMDLRRDADVAEDALSLRKTVRLTSPGRGRRFGLGLPPARLLTRTLDAEKPAQDLARRTDAATFACDGRKVHGMGGAVDDALKVSADGMVMDVMRDKFHPRAGVGPWTEPDPQHRGVSSQLPRNRSGFRASGGTRAPALEARTTGRGGGGWGAGPIGRPLPPPPPDVEGGLLGLRARLAVHRVDDSPLRPAAAAQGVPGSPGRDAPPHLPVLLRTSPPDHLLPSTTPAGLRGTVRGRSGTRRPDTSRCCRP